MSKFKVGDIVVLTEYSDTRMSWIIKRHLIGSMLQVVGAPKRANHWSPKFTVWVKTEIPINDLPNYTNYVSPAKLPVGKKFLRKATKEERFSYYMEGPLTLVEEK